MKQGCLIILALILSANITFADNILVKVTPTQTISTAKKNSLTEGDTVNFRVIQDTKILKQDDIVTGIVTSIENNGFAGKEAQVVIENFKCNGKSLDGEIYLHGNVHKKLNDFVDGTISEFTMWMRGGEVIVKPNEQEFLLYIKDKK